MIILKILLFINLAFSHPNSEYEKEVINEENTEISENYIPDLEAYLGACADGDCIEFLSNYSILNVDQSKICIPSTECSFYDCMEDKFKCSTAGENYFTKFAKPACSKYTKNIQKNYFTKKGIKWIYSVMTCLQKGLIDECEIRGNCHKGSVKDNCSFISKFTLDFHPACYINSGVGVCKLPLKDKYNIWRTVSKFMSKNERAQAYKVIFECVNPF